MRTITTIDEASSGGGLALLRLLSWLSPAFPTGGYAYSHGLEWVVEAGDVRDRDSLLAWVGDLLRFGGGRNDAILLRHAHAAADEASLRDVAAFAASCAAGRERLAETLDQGGAFLAAARAWAPSLVLRPGERIAYPVAVGALAGALGVDVETTALAFLHGFAANLVSAAVRLVPLGQSVALAVGAALEPVLLEVAAASRDQPLDAIAGCCLAADIAAMRHETQRTRLFRT